MKLILPIVGVVMAFVAGFVAGAYITRTQRGGEDGSSWRGPLPDLAPTRVAEQLRAGDVEGALESVETRMDQEKAALLQGPRIVIDGVDFSSELLKQLSEYQRIHPLLLSREGPQPPDEAGRWELVSSNDTRHLRLIEVPPESLLAKLGLRAGEIILEYYGRPAADRSTLLIESIKRKTAFDLTVQGVDGTVRKVGYKPLGD